MFFNSLYFLFFFSFVYLTYWNINKKYRLNFLIFSGLIFYLSFSFLFLIHFLSIIFINYFFYFKIKSTKKKVYLVLSIVLNLSNLIFFKYFYLLVDFLFKVTTLKFFDEVKNMDIILPLAISFYTFQLISIATDTFKDEKIPHLGFRDYFLYILFFPVLIAGPIMRVIDFYPNLSRLFLDKNKVIRACYLMMSGLIKKILIADAIAIEILPLFSNPSEYHSFYILLGGMFYIVQIYCDFSGLTDMARSVGLFLGFELPENFLSPFFARSGRELWQRWHITFSTWIRDYIYFPLGGSKKGEIRTYLNLIITMTLGGLWHGANYTYIFWGFYWGCILSIERFLERKLNLPLTPSKNLFLIALKCYFIFFLFSISGLMFRADNLLIMKNLFYGVFVNFENSLSEIFLNSQESWIYSSLNLLSSDSFFSFQSIKNLEKIFYLCTFSFIFQFIKYKSLRINPKYEPYLVIFLGVIVSFLIALFSEETGNFIYYQF